MLGGGSGPGFARSRPPRGPPGVNLKAARGGGVRRTTRSSWFSFAKNEPSLWRTNGDSARAMPARPRDAPLLAMKVPSVVSMRRNSDNEWFPALSRIKVVTLPTFGGGLLRAVDDMVSADRPDQVHVSCAADTSPEPIRSAVWPVPPVIDRPLQSRGAIVSASFREDAGVWVNRERSWSESVAAREVAQDSEDGQEQVDQVE